MVSWKARLGIILAMLAMVLVVSVPAMADEEFLATVEIDDDCSGDLIEDGDIEDGDIEDGDIEAIEDIEDEADEECVDDINLIAPLERVEDSGSWPWDWEELQ